MPVLGDIESIITYLVDKNYWNYLNCEHLFLVIDTYGNDALKKQKKEFEKRRILDRCKSLNDMEKLWSTLLDVVYPRLE